MKTRAEAARFAESQFIFGGAQPRPEKGGFHHYGKQDVRQLLDYIYGRPPKNDAERLSGARIDRANNPPTP